MLNHQPQAQFQQVVPVGALPVVIGTAIVHTPDGPMVLVQAHTPQGVNCYLLPPDTIDEQLIPQLRNAALQARTGLQLGLHLPGQERA